MELKVRPAARSDAGDLARLVDLAGEGLPAHVWTGLAEPGEDVWSVGRRRAERDEGAFSWRNALVGEIGGRVVGALTGYPIREAASEAEIPPMFRPLQALENEALGTWYVNVLATYPEWRGRGIASGLMSLAERRGAEMAGTSLIVADANARARRFYLGRGYVEKASRPIVKETWTTESRDWLLMVKPPA